MLTEVMRYYGLRYRIAVLFRKSAQATSATRLEIQLKLPAVLSRGSCGNRHRRGCEGNAAALPLRVARGDRHGPGRTVIGSRSGKRNHV